MRASSQAKAKCGRLRRCVPAWKTRPVRRIVSAQDQALGDVLRAGLFAIHVLAGLGGVHRHRGVPVRAGGDQHGVDIVAVEQLAKVAKHEAALIAVQFVDPLLDGDAAGFLDVADGGELHVLLLQEAAQVVRAAVADADAADDDPLAGGDGAVAGPGPSWE